MATSIKYSPYSSIAPYFASADAPTGLSGVDIERIQSYFMYEKFYWNHPESFKLKTRGGNANPIYLPSAKEIIEATNRFLGKGFDITLAPEMGTPDAQLQTKSAFDKLFRRELFWTKYAAQKRFGLIWGDTIWHITADPNKPQGSRIRLHDVHPSRYFPIKAENDDTRIIGCHLVDVVEDPRDKNKTVNRVQTYRRAQPDDIAETGLITTELALYETGKWDDRNLEPSDIKKVQQLVPPTALPPQITSIPVYHIRNTWDSGTDFGSSTLRGIESVMNAANQAASDQDLALAFNGLGMYWTDAPPPRDAQGNPTSWPMGPARMAEVPAGNQVGRLSGVDNLESSISHIKLLLEKASTGSGVPEIAAGRVDVSVAESGIALMMQMAPIIAANEEKEGAMLAKYDQILYDLKNQWFPGYEQMNDGVDCEVTCIVDDPMPTDKQAEIDRVIALVGAKLMSPEEGRVVLLKLGYKLDSGGLDAIAKREQQLAEARSHDSFANRFSSELDQFTGSAGNGTLKTPAQDTGGTSGQQPVTSSAPAGPEGGGPPVA